MHDADAAGTLIYQSLQEATQRPAGTQGPGDQSRAGAGGGAGDGPRGRGRRGGRAPQADRVLCPCRLAGLAAAPPGRAERDDHAAVHRVAGRQDGGVRQRQAGAAGNGAHERPERDAREPAAPADHRADPARGQDRGEGRCGAPGDRPARCRRSCARRWKLLSLDQPAASWRAAIERIADQLLASQGRDRGPQEHGA